MPPRTVVAALLWASARAWVAPGAPRRAVPLFSTKPKAKNYYDFRRENDGELTAEVAEAASPVAADDDDDVAPPPGQRHFHRLHQDEIEDGIFTHLREMGLGLFEDARAGAASGFGSFGDRDGPGAVTETDEWRKLSRHARKVEKTHLRRLLESEQRVAEMSLDAADVGVFLDWTRQKVDDKTMRLLFKLARRMDVPRKVEQMRRGERINSSERRAVLHTALRAPRGAASQTAPADSALVPVDEAIAASCDVRDRLFAFVDDVRRGAATSAAGEPFESVVAVGIGGSYLGPEFIVQATAGVKAMESDGRDLEVRFVANVDPVAFTAAKKGLDPRKTLVIVVSKSWSTAETLRNAAKVKAWVLDAFPDEDEAAVVKAHFVACASRTAHDRVSAWGVDADARLFEFWNWVGGRYSASSSAGLLPLALARGSSAARGLLEGMHAMDEHFYSKPLEENAPAVMALLGIWNVNFLGLGARAVVPYSEALARFAAHVQQLEMESHGKSVTIDGRPLDFTTGEIVIGEPGTNAQHSFFQLLHQGQAVPTDFIGFARPDDATVDFDGHDELMANFFAQPDALAVGRAFNDVLVDATFGDGDAARA
ncbi:glucose-6-phosphate isomerase [Aureococcus anophagefferens]|uniref:Glucose-6-phosphate isomerase n=1 Tax=Aureococcus anophagefferens TaxID=44056 RepID=A0ABR1FWR6_AURAN